MSEKDKTKAYSGDDYMVNSCKKRYLTLPSMMPAVSTLNNMKCLILSL